MATDKQWFKRMTEIFSPHDPSVQALRDAVDRAEHRQEVNLDHFFNNGLRWNSNADPADVRAVFDALRQLRQEASTQDQRMVLHALLDNLPYRTNRDVAKLTSRIQVAELGLGMAGRLATKETEITQRVTALVGHGVQGYNRQLRRRALIRMAAQTGNSTDTLPLIFKHAQSLSIDLDRTIDYAMQNHVNPHSMKKAAAEALEAQNQWNYNTQGWRTPVQKAYMHTKADFERIYVTEAKATQSKVAAREFRRQGYKYMKVVSRKEPNVCRFCEGMDGTRVRIDQMVVGTNVPPFHPRCCCNVIPATTPIDEALDDAFNELGI